MNDGLCETCKWWQNGGDIVGHCTRFPKWVEVWWNHYCGEWKDKNDD